MEHLERLAFDFLRVTEAAAMSCVTVAGHGDRHLADELATEAMREVLNTLDIRGRIVIGEGERDEAPMLFIDEEVGTKNGPEIDIAVDPLEGTNLSAELYPNSICVMAISEKGGLTHAPDTYMNKLIVGPKARHQVSILDPVDVTIKNIARAEDIGVGEVIITVLDRDRHKQLIQDIRDAGAKVRLITDGDICAGLAAALPHVMGHAVMGIGAAPEGVITAAAMRALGGEIQGQFVAKDEEQKKRLAQMGITDLNRVYMTEELASGDDILFVATGVTDGNIIRGVSVARHEVKTHSLLLNARRMSIHYVESTHLIK